MPVIMISKTSNREANFFKTYYNYVKKENKKTRSTEDADVLTVGLGL